MKGEKEMRIYNIVWDTDGEDVNELNLPDEVFLEVKEDNEEYIADMLSDIYGWCIYSFETEEDLPEKVDSFLKSYDPFEYRDTDWSLEKTRETIKDKPEDIIEFLLNVISEYE